MKVRRYLDDCCMADCKKPNKKYGYCEQHLKALGENPRLLPVEARFLHRVRIRPDGCWIYSRLDRERRPVSFRHGKKSYSPRRFAWHIWVGLPVPPKNRIFSMCGSGVCVNPYHLISSVPGVDLWRALGKCPNGHTFTEDMVRTESNGVRICIHCKHESERSRYRMNAAKQDRLIEKLGITG